ncbi:archaeal ATPase [Dorcoceras hygrometricum]|uniref:Archaeal ATPase n=1 Tax=Dorcoceras hygrometricum TaxID=472368 RepID=A0A2Z7CHC3_9LAMI|nr:archaeal ATPase [Dorcoceras hygrometricum]
MESAVELAMETSRVDSVVPEATGSADEDSADEKRCARYGMSCDDISLDVITISSWLSADEVKRKSWSDVSLFKKQEEEEESQAGADEETVDESIISRYSRSKKKKKNRKLELMKKRRSAGALKYSAGRLCVVFQQTKLQRIQSQRKDIQTQEDSGEAFDEQDASNSSIQSKSLYESAVANQPVASFASSRQEIQAQRIEEVAKRSSRCVKSAAKQLTIYER